MRNEKSKIVDSYLDKYPNLQNQTLAKLLYKENKTLFKDVDQIRTMIRYRKGSRGATHLNNLKSDKHLTPEKRQEKYNLPKSKAVKYKPYSLRGNKGLIFSDVHIPFHSVDAHNAMFDYTHKMDFDFILLLGDIMDCFEVSQFTHDPDLVPFPEERDLTKDYLKELKRIYPNTRIYYKFGNHEKRFETYIQAKAPELWGFAEFRLNVLLDLYNLGIEYIEEDKYVEISGLYALHGHEYKNAITSPANPARTFFLRTKATTIGGHYHQSSEHNEPTINDEHLTCWSLGCMCQLHPKYMPLNKWTHGFAIYERYDSKFWNIQNKKIMEGHVV